VPRADDLPLPEIARRVGQDAVVGVFRPGAVAVVSALDAAGADVVVGGDELPPARRVGDGLLAVEFIVGRGDDPPAGISAGPEVGSWFTSPFLLWTSFVFHSV
jgi:hypothetical protein